MKPVFLTVDQYNAVLAAAEGHSHGEILIRPTSIVTAVSSHVFRVALPAEEHDPERDIALHASDLQTWLIEGIDTDVDGDDVTHVKIWEGGVAFARDGYVCLEGLRANGNTAPARIVVQHHKTAVSHKLCDNLFAKVANTDGHQVSSAFALDPGLLEHLRRLYAAFASANKGRRVGARLLRATGCYEPTFWSFETDDKREALFILMPTKHPAFEKSTPLPTPKE